MQGSEEAKNSQPHGLHFADSGDNFLHLSNDSMLDEYLGRDTFAAVFKGCRCIQVESTVEYFHAHCKPNSTCGQ